MPCQHTQAGGASAFVKTSTARVDSFCQQAVGVTSSGIYRFPLHNGARSGKFGIEIQKLF